MTPSCGIKCATSGHEVRLIPPAYIKPYLRPQKNNAADAICEAVTRPSMRFVPLKNEEQQATLMLHSARDLLISQRTSLINALRGHFAELGIVVAQGARNAQQLTAIVNDERNTALHCQCTSCSPTHYSDADQYRDADWQTRQGYPCYSSQ